ncbi:MAG: flavodoxin family protein [Clostridia bacterium]|nr:flavodoxin family protein [Clostridia bacterium]
MKKVLILSGSPRKGNSDALCDAFLKGAIEAGHEVEKIRVAEKKVHYCTGCYVCKQTGGNCVYQDDMGEILQKIIAADVIALASPVYFYSICAQLKTVLDRTVARWTEIKNKQFYFLVTAAEDEEGTADTTLACMRGFMDCCDDSKEMGVVEGLGVYELGEMAQKGEKFLQEAYTLGKNIR